MIEFLFLAGVAASSVPSSAGNAMPCEGVRAIEASVNDRPRSFTSLREQIKKMATVRDSNGQRVQREVSETVVKNLPGFSRCQFVYSVSNIDLACYIGTTFADTETNAIAGKLTSTAEAIGQCLTNRALVRSESEPGSTPSIGFGAGPNQPFWQISMVPTQEDLSRIQPEVLILGPANANPTQRAVGKAKRKKR